MEENVPRRCRGGIFRPTKGSMANRGKCHRMSVFYCSLSEGIKLQVSHTAAREKVSFDRVD